MSRTYLDGIRVLALLLLAVVAPQFAIGFGVPMMILWTIARRWKMDESYALWGLFSFWGVVVGVGLMWLGRRTGTNTLATA